MSVRRRADLVAEDPLIAEAIIAALLVLAFYLGKRWKEVSVENLQLRKHVTWLKRQLNEKPW